jgi:hypothetical protein
MHLERQETGDDVQVVLHPTDRAHSIETGTESSRFRQTVEKRKNSLSSAHFARSIGRVVDEPCERRFACL